MSTPTIHNSLGTAPALEVRVRAHTQAGRFRHGPLRLDDRWSTVDAARPEIRVALWRSVGVQVRVHPNDRAKLEEVGLRWRRSDGVLMDVAKLKELAAEVDEETYSRDVLGIVEPEAIPTAPAIEPAAPAVEPAPPRPGNRKQGARRGA